MGCRVKLEFRQKGAEEEVGDLALRNIPRTLDAPILTSAVKDGRPGGGAPLTLLDYSEAP